MANVGDAIKQGVADTGEAVGKSLVNEGGEVLQDVAESFGLAKPVDPEEEAKRKAEEQRQLQNQQQFLDQMAANENRSRQQKALEKQQQTQEEQDEAEKTQVHQLEVEEKQESQAVLNAKRVVEVKNQGAG